MKITQELELKITEDLHKYIGRYAEQGHLPLYVTYRKVILDFAIKILEKYVKELKDES